MIAAMERAGEGFVELLRALPAEAASLPVPGLDWTVGDLAAHEYTVLRRAVDPRRASRIDALADLNATAIDEVETRDLGELAGLIEAVMAAGLPLRRALPRLWRLRVGRWPMLKLHFGLEADLPMAFAWATGDMLVHGWELSQATGEPWEIPPADAAVCLEALMPQLGAWVRRDVVEGPVECRVVSFGPDVDPMELTVGAGTYRANVTGVGRGHATFVDPVPFMLHLMGRIPPTGDPVTDHVASWFLPV